MISCSGHSYNRYNSVAFLTAEKSPNGSKFQSHKIWYFLKLTFILVFLNHGFKCLKNCPNIFLLQLFMITLFQFHFILSILYSLFLYSYILSQFFLSLYILQLPFSLSIGQKNYEQKRRERGREEKELKEKDFKKGREVNQIIEKNGKYFPPEKKQNFSKVLAT